MAKTPKPVPDQKTSQNKEADHVKNKRTARSAICYGPAAPEKAFQGDTKESSEKRKEHRGRRQQGELTNKKESARPRRSSDGAKAGKGKDSKR